MAAFPTTDLALTFDARRFACDVVLSADASGGLVHDLALADTPVSPLLMSLGCDRRAAPDDTLPTGSWSIGEPGSLGLRRGWPGDGLDRIGRLAGSRLWLLVREKKTEETRLKAELYVREALAWIEAEYGLTPEIEVSWSIRSDRATGWLQIRVSVDGRAVTLLRKVG
jgi:phage gp46-like protein